MSMKIVVGDCFEVVYGMAKTEIAIAYTRSGPNCNALGFGATTHNSYSLCGSEPISPTLHLPISEPWFSRILSGEKREEYREILGQNRTCYNVGLLTNCGSGLAQYEANNFGDVYLSRLLQSQFKFKPFKVIHLTNGYGHHRPQLWAHIKEITIGRGNPEWGAPTDRDVFIIKLGDVFHTKNVRE